MAMTSVRRSVCLIPKFALCVGRSLTVQTSLNKRHFRKPTCFKSFSSTVPVAKKETVNIYFVDRDGDHIEVAATVGSNLLDVAIDHDIELEASCPSDKLEKSVNVKALAMSRLLIKGLGPPSDLHNFNRISPFRDISKEDITSLDMKFVQKNRVTVNLTLPDGSQHTARAKVGDNLLDVIIENDIDIDGFGACEGTLSCSTCHLIFKEPDYEKIPEKPTDEELDMLDLAFGLTDTSRLGCQVIVTKDMEGWEIEVPSGVADARDV